MAEHRGWPWVYVLLAVVVVGLLVLWGLELSGVAELYAQVPTTIALVVVTITYAKSTYDIAQDTKRHRESSEEQLQVLKDQQYNAVAPVVALASASDANAIKVHLVNVGAGPALNIRCWIEDKQHKELKGKGFAIAALGIRVREDLVPVKMIRTNVQGYQLEKNKCRLRIEYEDIFGQKYESTFDYDPEKAKGPVMGYRRVSGRTPSTEDETR